MPKSEKSRKLILKNKELTLQSKRRLKWGDELVATNRELLLLIEEREKRAAELAVANTELAFQNNEKEKRAAELVVANNELAFLNEEKEKRAAELAIANKQLAFQNDEKEKRAAELAIANKELAFQNKEKEKRAVELTVANLELETAQQRLREYSEGLEKMMFMTSHRVRQPICRILGLINMLDQAGHSPDDLKTILSYLKTSSLELDAFTRELTRLMTGVEEEGLSLKSMKKTA